MPTVRVHGPLKKLAGGISEHPVGGDTVEAALRALERQHPALAGWVLDERGRIRRHINVYVNGELGGEDKAVADTDRLEVLPAISGGELDDRTSPGNQEGSLRARGRLGRGL
jgi:molybdopterin converting factor small subunit